MSDIDRLEVVAQKIQELVDLLAKVFNHHESFLTEWLESFKEIVNENTS